MLGRAAIAGLGLSRKLRSPPELEVQTLASLVDRRQAFLSWEGGVCSGMSSFVPGEAIKVHK